MLFQGNIRVPKCDEKEEIKRLQKDNLFNLEFSFVESDFVEIPYLNGLTASGKDQILTHPFVKFVM